MDVGNPRISIIVPIYNSEKYLVECLESIAAQKYKNIEVVLVDDGSADNSLNICREYESRDKRFKVIHQENAGVSAARNAGLEVASGDCIAWVDSDDTISSDYIKNMVEKLIQYDVKVVISVPRTFEYEQLLTKNSAIMQKYLMGQLTSYLWSTLIDKKLYEGLKFESIKIGEDALMLCQIFSLADSLVCFNNCGYFYRVRDDSVSTERSYESLSMWIWGVKKQDEIVKTVCPKCIKYMNYKKTKYALSFLIWIRNIGDKRALTLKNELLGIVKESIFNLPFLHITFNQYRELIRLIIQVLTQK